MWVCLTGKQGHTFIAMRVEQWYQHHMRSACVMPHTWELPFPAFYKWKKPNCLFSCGRLCWRGQKLFSYIYPIRHGTLAHDLCPLGPLCASLWQGRMVCSHQRAENGRKRKGLRKAMIWGGNVDQNNEKMTFPPCLSAPLQPDPDLLPS